MKKTFISFGYGLCILAMGGYLLSNLLFTLSPNQNLYVAVGAFTLVVIGNIVNLVRLPAGQTQRKLREIFMHLSIIAALVMAYSVIFRNIDLSDAVSYTGYTYLAGLAGWGLWVEARDWLAKRKKSTQ